MPQEINEFFQKKKVKVEAAPINVKEQRKQCISSSKTTPEVGDSFSRLENEVKLCILQNLTMAQILNLRVLSRYWNQLIMNYMNLWESLDLSGDVPKSIDTTKWKALLNYSKNKVKSLSIQGSSKFGQNSTGAFFEELFRVKSSCSERPLKSLQLFTAVRVVFMMPTLVKSIQDFSPFSYSLSQLKSLIFIGSKMDELSLVKFIVMYRPQLEVLKLRFCTIEAYPNLGRHNHLLESLLVQGKCLLSWLNGYFSKNNSKFSLKIFEFSHNVWHQSKPSSKSTLLESFLFNLYIRNCPSLQEFIFNLKSTSISLDKLLSLIRQFPHLELLHLYDNCFITEEDPNLTLVKFLDSLRNSFTTVKASSALTFKHIFLGNLFSRANYGHLQDLTQLFRNLESLDLSFSPLEDSHLENLVSLNPSLKYLCLNGCQRLSGTGLMNCFLKISGSLLKVELDHCLFNISNLLEEFVENCSMFGSLRSISLKQPNNCSASSLVSFAKTFSKLLIHFDVSGISTSVSIMTIQTTRNLLSPHCTFIFD